MSEMGTQHQEAADAAGTTASFWSMFSQKHTSVVSTVAFKGGLVVTGSYDKTFKVWDTSTGTAVFTSKPHGGAVLAVDLTKDNRFVFTAHGRTVAKLSMQTFMVEAKFVHTHGEQTGGDKGEAKSIAVSNDGSRLITGLINSNDPTEPQIKVWDVDTGVVITCVGNAHKENVWALRWMGGGSAAFVSGSGDGTAATWWVDADSAEISKPTVRLEGGHATEDGAVWAVAVAADNSVFTGSADGTAIRWNPDTAEVITKYTGHTKHIRALDVDEQSRWLLTGSVDCSCRQFDIASGTCVRIFMHVAGVRGIACNDGRMVSAGMDGIGRFWLLRDQRGTIEGEMVTANAGALQNVSKSQVVVLVVQNILIVLQLMIFVFSEQFGWDKKLVGWLVSAARATSLDLDLFTSEHRIFVATVIAAFAVAVLTVLAFVFDVHGRLNDYIARLNREGRGIKMHWDHGLKIDFRTKTHRFASYLANAVLVLQWAASTVLLMPILGQLFQGLSCAWGGELCQMGSSPQARSFGAGCGVVVVLFSTVATRISAVGGDVNHLIPLHVSGFAIHTVIHHRFFTSWRCETSELLGPFTYDNHTIWKFAPAECFFKIALIGLLALLLFSEKTGAVGSLFVMAALMAVSIQLPPYVHSTLSRAVLTSRVLLMWSMIVAVALAYASEENSSSLAIVWYAGAALFLPAAYTLSGRTSTFGGRAIATKGSNATSKRAQTPRATRDSVRSRTTTP